MMMNICWHKYPDEKPCDSWKFNDVIVVIENIYDDCPSIQACCYDEREDKFFTESAICPRCNMSTKHYINGKVLYWIFVCELETPEDLNDD